MLHYEKDEQQYATQQLQRGRSNPVLNHNKTLSCDQQSWDGHKWSLTMPFFQPQKENSKKMKSL